MAKSTEKDGGKTKEAAKKANYQTANNNKSGNRTCTYSFRRTVKGVESIMEEEGTDPHFKVTRKIDDETRIGKWVADIRLAYRAIQKKKNPNVDSRLLKLNKINFMWHERESAKESM